jgi:putative spermidine/putrescine transport system ATP-binding protein
MTSTTGSALRVTSVYKSFDQVEVLKNLSLEVRAGEFLTLLGPSGCGKTTLLNIIAGFFPPDRGLIEIEDVDVTAVPAHRRDTAMVFQNYALFPHLTVARNVAFGLRMRTRLARAEIEKRVAEALDLVQMDGMQDRYPQQLSGGQQQRTALARALVLKPALLLLDEPLSNLDANLREAMQVELRFLQRDIGITTILVTHDQVEAFVVSDRIAVMHGGRVEQLGTPSELYQGPVSRKIANFVGRMNWIPGHLVSGGIFEADLGSGVRIRIPVNTICPAGTPGDLMLRPEHIRVTSGPTSRGDGELVGKVISQIYLGPMTFCHVRIGETTLIAHHSGPPLAGLDRAFVSWPERESSFMPSDQRDIRG